jgi:transcriptional regulator with XRE-family HTH domain
MKDMPADQAEAAASHLIQMRLRTLFEASTEGRPPYTEAEVARELTKAGHRITTEGIRNLLRAPRINPKASTLRALAQFFDVPAGYLLGDQEEPEEHSRRVRVMARSITKLSPAAQDGIAVIIENLLQVEETVRGGDSNTPTHRPGTE